MPNTRQRPRYRAIDILGVRYQDVWRTVVRSYIYICLAMVMLSGLYVTSVIVYLIIYHMYIPHDSISVPLYLDFSQGSPYAAIETQYIRNLVSNVDYDIFLVLDLYQSDFNRNVGNFMARINTVDHLTEFLQQHPRDYHDGIASSSNNVLSTFSGVGHWPFTHNSLLHNLDYPALYTPPFPLCPSSSHSVESSWTIGHGHDVCSSIMDRPNGPPLVKQTMTRPLSLPYSSPLLHAMKLVTFYPLYALGYMTESSRVEVKMISDWIHDYSDKDQWLVIELDRRVNIENAFLTWQTQWKGVRYFMYHYRIIIFVVATWIFWVFEVIATGLVAAVVVHLYYSRFYTDPTQQSPGPTPPEYDPSNDDEDEESQRTAPVSIVLQEPDSTLEEISTEEEGSDTETDVEGQLLTPEQTPAPESEPTDSDESRYMDTADQQTPVTTPYTK